MNEKDNRCSIPFIGYPQIMLGNNTISPCCKINQSPIIDGNLITQDTKDIRKAIKENKRHALCSACWETEDKGGPSFRIRNSTHKIRPIKWELMDINQPHTKALLVFSNKCQMMCVYCGPSCSTMWEKAQNIIPIQIITPTDSSIRTLLSQNTFKDISISGGEPLLEEKCIEFLMKLEFDPTRTISLITNLSYGPVVFQKLLNIIERHPNIIIMCSIDAIGYNVSRKYLNWELWNFNFKKLVDNLQHRIANYPIASVYTKSTFGLLNYKDIQPVIEYILDFRINGAEGITFDINPLSDDTVTSLASGEIDKSIQISLSDHYERLLTIKERNLIHMTNKLLQNTVYNPLHASRTEEHIRQYVD